MKTYGGFLISQIRQLANRSFEKILKAKGIDAFNGPQGRILYVLWEREDLSISEIARLTSLANTTLTGMLDRMEDQGLIMRIPDRQNRRQIKIRLTDKARALQEAYDEVSEENNAVFYAGFTETEIVQFENSLRRILNNYEEAEKHGK